MQRRQFRSVLSTPADNWNLLQKQVNQPVDAAMIDLEHALHPARKGEGRAMAARALRELNYRSATLVRLNAPQSDDFEQDVRALVHAPPAIYLIPKVIDADAAESVIARIEAIELEAAALHAPAIWFMIETAACVLQADRIAALPRVEGIVIGNVDLEKHVGFTTQPGNLNPALQFAWARVVFAAAAANKVALAGAITAISDPVRIEASMREAVRMGFKGAIVVSPRQIEAIHRAFIPNEQEVATARRLLDTFAASWKSGSAVAVVDGCFVDDAVADLAADVLRRAGIPHDNFAQ